MTLPQTMVTELPFAVAVAKGQRAQFLTQFSAGMAAIHADGTWQRINNQRTGKSPSAGTERQYIGAN